MKRKPSGFVAKCECGATVGAMDFERTDRKDAGKILGDWLFRGCTVEPRFAGTWSATIEPCKCNSTVTAPAQEAAPMSDEEILKFICDNTGKRINLPNFTLDELIAFARTIERRILAGSAKNGEAG